MFVLSHFGLKSVIGFGVGAGANILARFALNNPDKVSGHGDDDDDDGF